MLQRLSRATSLLTTDVGAICGIFGTSALAGGFLAPVLPLYLSSLGASPSEVGFLFTAFAITFAVFEATWGWISEHLAARTILSLRMLGAAGAILLFTQTTSLWALYAIQLVRGAIESAVWPVGRAMVATAIPPQQRGAAMGLITTAVWGSMSVGALAGGVLADFVGYNSVFLLSAGILLAGAVLVLARIRRAAPSTPSLGSPKPPAIPLEPPQALSRKEIYGRFAILGIIAFTVFMGRSSQNAFTPLFGRDVAGSEATDIGVLFLVSGLASVATLIPTGYLSDRQGRKGFIVWGVLISGLALIGFAQSTGFWWLLLFMAAGAVGRGMVNPAILAMVSELSPPRIQGRMMGLFGACEDLGLVVGPAIAGLVWTAWGPRSAFWVAGLITMAGAMVAVLLIKEREWQFKAASAPTVAAEIPRLDPEP